MPPPRRVFLLPGTGADGRLFGPDWQKIQGEIFRVDWRTCAGATSIAEAAEKLRAAHDIGEHDTLIGVSLGGMVAAEIAKNTRVQHLVLLGSALHPDEISPLLASIHRLIRLVPLSLCARLVRRSKRPEFRMFADADQDFVRAMILAIFRWEGRRELAARTVRLHGENDPVIPCPPEVTRRIKGGHMFMVRHPAETVAAVRECLDSPTPIGA